MSDTAVLRCDDSEAEIAARGAEVTAWRVGGHDLLWHGDPAFWPRRAPVLFPVCGWLNGRTLRAKGRAAACPVHGFAPEAAFALDRTGPDRARLRLADSAVTRAIYPYAFRLDIEVRLSARGLSYDFTVANPGDELLPYALGFHPGFRWPFDGEGRAGHRLLFDAPERPAVERIAPGGLFTGEQRPVPLRGRELAIAAALADQDSLVFLDAQSRGLTFAAPSGAGIRVATEGFPHWVLWSPPGAGFLCIEGWTGTGDPVGFTGDITAKPGQILLAPGEQRRARFSMEFLPHPL